MLAAGSDGALGLNDFPFEVGIGHGALEEFAGAPFETAEAIGSAKNFEVAAARFAGASGVGSGGTGSDERGFLANGAVAIDAIDFDGGARFAVDFSVAVIVLGEMAIGALHAFFEMDVGEMDSFLETPRVVEGDGLAVFVEPVPFAVVVVDGAEDPAVAVEIGELRGFELGVEFRSAGLVEEFFFTPVAASGGGWIMDDDEWHDDARMLERIEALVDPLNGDNWSAVSARARTAAQPTLAAMVQSTVAAWQEALARAPVRTPIHAIAAGRCLAALHYVAWIPPAPSAARAPAKTRAYRTLALVARAALALRHTPPGKLLYRLTPQPLVDALKQRL